jgi:SAM-dependent methyltransferase
LKEGWGNEMATSNMSELDYQRFYEKVGKINGWDFSELKSTSVGVKWNFYEKVVKSGKHSDILLDIGTGGGENVLKIASSFSSIVGIDISKGMLKTANANLKKSGVANVSFFQQSSDDIQFPSNHFDLASSCHAPFDSKQVAKVLKKGGTFLTQQVSEGDKLILKREFGRGQAFEEKDGTLKERYIQELNEAGFSEVKAYDYNAIEYYERPEDLIFLLKHTPIIPNFGEEDQDFSILKKFIEKYHTKKGICTNSKRFLIIANK